MSIAPGVKSSIGSKSRERHVLAERHEMRLVVAGADRAVAVDRLDAVPDLRRRLGRRVGAHRAGNRRSRLAAATAAIAARCRASRSSRKGAAASGQNIAASRCVDGAPLSSISRWKLASAAAGSHLSSAAIEGCTRRSQISVGRCRQQPEPDRAGRGGYQDEQRRGDRRRGPPHRRHRRQRRAAEQRRQRGRQHGQETQPVNADPGGALQHRQRARETARPDIADEVPRKPGQDMAAQPFGGAPEQPRTGRSAPPATAATGARRGA